MRISVILFIIFASAQAGPYKGASRAVASPLVDAAQTYIHQQFLQEESLALLISLDISKLADNTNKEVFHITHGAQARLRAIAADVYEEAAVLRPLHRECVNEAALRKTAAYFRDLTDKLYNCTHALSNMGASFEVLITEALIAARDQVMYIKQAMTFCDKNKDGFADVECLDKLVDEGMLMLGKLPEKTATILYVAQGAKVQLMDRLDSCLVRHVSAGDQRQLEDVERMKKCVEESNTKRHDQ